MRYYRLKKGLTQEEVASKLEILTSTYNMMENNKRKISVEFAKKLEKVFEATIDEIFFNNRFHI